MADSSIQNTDLLIVFVKLNLKGEHRLRVPENGILGICLELRGVR
jgi:hypothetical protein